jgi:hypothetical protein
VFALGLVEPGVLVSGEVCPGWFELGVDGWLVLGVDVWELLPVGLLWVCAGAEPEGVVLSGLVL